MNNPKSLIILGIMLILLGIGLGGVSIAVSGAKTALLITDFLAALVGAAILVWGIHMNGKK